MKNGIFLFNSDDRPLPDFVNDLDEDNIASCCDYKIFLRGAEYYESHLVKDAFYSHEQNSVKAIVKGTEKYTVEIFQQNDEIVGSCTCPYEGVCKHIVALLLYISENDIEKLEKEPVSINDNNFIGSALEQYLSNLDKKELIQLVEKFAPKSFINEINRRNSDYPTAFRIFKSVRKNIEELFEDEEMLFSPSEFDDTLNKNLEKLKGLEKQLAKEIKALIIYIIENVEIAFNEGYLYIESYPHDDYFESESFNEFVCGFIRKLQFNERIEYLISLDEVLNNMSYDTFESIGDSFAELISDEEKAELKALMTEKPGRFTDSFLSRFYPSITSSLNADEKLKILGRLKTKDTSYLIELCELLVSRNKKDEAYNELNENLKLEFAVMDEKLLKLFLDLSADLGKDIPEASLKVISFCPTSEMLVKIKSFSGADFERCKDILRNKNPEELLFYLEKEQSFKEAVELINRGIISEYMTFEFFKRNKKQVVSEAGKFFVSIINKNLPFTGDNHYAIIAESLSHLKKINPKTAEKIASDIRFNFKRRTKLMSMINRL